MTTTPIDRGAIRALLAQEIAGGGDRLVPAALLKTLSARPGARAILLYGARRRGDTGVPSGPVDLYLLTEGGGGWGVGPMLHHLLPPAISFEGAGAAEAKLATMRLSTFRARMRRMSWDTTLWARFSQPVRLLWSTDEKARSEVLEALTDAVETAGWWAAHLAEPTAAGADRWAGLYRRTYGAELRVERATSRAMSLIQDDAARFSALARLAIEPHGIPSEQARSRAEAAWHRRVRVGKLLNLARLAKAAVFTRGALTYALSKVERHSGAPVELSPWQRRWPVLGAPVALWRLWRERRLR